MRRFLFHTRRWIGAGTLLLCGPWLGVTASGQALPLSFNQDAFLYNTNSALSGLYAPAINWQSLRGVPLSSTVNPVIGSDGRAPSSGLLGTTNQFSTFVAVGAVPTQSGNTLNTNINFAGNAANLNWPRIVNSGTIVGVLRFAQIGAPYLINQAAVPFGSIIPPPLTDENGAALSNNVAQTYWNSAPYGSANTTSYYYSPNAKSVFATQPGQITIIWEKALASTSVPIATNSGVGILTNGINYFILYTNYYLVSGTAVKTPQLMYWTEGTHFATGQPVSVPQARVSTINVVYNTGFPQYVVPGDTNATITITNTLWFDTAQNSIHADNASGRVFIELLGNVLPDGTRAYLGFEIVDVSAEPVPTDVNVELGTRIPAYQDGRDDSALAVSPLHGTTTYYYQQTLPNGRINLYATHLTADVNDFQSYWLDTGVAGLKWPFLFNRYHEYWPTNASEYVHYARPLAADAAQAAQTAVQLPASEAPSIAFQDSDIVNPTRAVLTSQGVFYTLLDTDHPVHRTLLQFLSGQNVFYERVFSWLDLALANNALLTNTIATTLSDWNPTNSSLVFTNPYLAPRVVTANVTVGDRIVAPSGEIQATNGLVYLAGSIVQSAGNGFNPQAYLDPFATGFTNAQTGAIIPVNAVPGSNNLEVLWFRTDNANSALGFQPSYWPAVVGYYRTQWPAPNPVREIVMANNAGSGSLAGYVNAKIYAQNNAALPGYNPNEEHALILGGAAYALRDDLNNTNAPGYTSAPFVLIQYLAADLRPAMVLFHVRREAPEQGELFDYVVQAGAVLQAPMPLPLLPPPVVGSGTAAVNFNTAPPSTSGDLPANWNPSTPLAYYSGYTFQDRNHNFWVYRGPHAGLPALQLGAYNPTNNSFGALPSATAVAGQNFTYFLHVSRLSDGFTFSSSPALPGWLAITNSVAGGLALTGVPPTPGSSIFTITISDTDGSAASAALAVNVVSNGLVVAQGPLAITSTNQYSGATITFSNRPPFLAAAPTPTNSFTMRFYYVNQPLFDWPGVANPPTNGAIVPYLLPRSSSGGFTGDPTSSASKSLDIVYRPTWPSIVQGQPVPVLFSGQTLTTPLNGLSAVRGQSSAQVLYQQSIATNDITQPGTYQSVTLFDPTVEKTYNLGATGLPSSVVSTRSQGLIYFATLPPNLVNRVWFDPNTTNLVLSGKFIQQTVGDNYLFLNVLNGADLSAVDGLCSPADPNYMFWTNAVANLSAPLFTFGQALDPGGNPIPGTYVEQVNATESFSAGQLVSIANSDQQVDSYALGATGPGIGYISYIVNNGINPKFAGNPVSVSVARVGGYVAGTNPPGLYPGQLVAVLAPNPLSQAISFQHTLDLGGNTANYQYDWRIQPPNNGLQPTSDPSTWAVLTNGNDVSHLTLGGNAGVQSLSDNFVAVRYRETDPAALPANTNWSAWATPTFAPGYIKRVLEGINPFQQTSADLFDNPVDTTGSILTQAGARWEGNVALNADTLTNAGLIAVYETVLKQGEAISVDSGINYGPANDALLLAAGEISDLYSFVASDASASAANPTISIGTDNATFGNIATSLFCFMGEEPSLLEQELALLRGRDDSVTTVTEKPVYNRLYWNYTHGIASGEVIYALNFNIQDQNGDGVINAADAAILYPMGHGDAYGHYLSALGNYWSLLMNPNFDWVPHPDTVSILGASVAVNYEHERKFAAAAGSLAQTGLKVFGLTWREGYTPGTRQGWRSFDTVVTNPAARTYQNANVTKTVAKYWGLDHWAARTAQGAYLNWLVGNAILPPVDPNPNDQGIQKVDRTTVPELTQLPQIANQLQTDMNNAEAGFTPFDLSQNAIPFDLNPQQVTGANPLTHFEQIYQRAVVALNNAVVAFDGAQHVTQQLRSEQNSLADLQAQVTSQELAYNNQLIELYGTPYPNDIGPGGTYPQGYNGPDLIHYTYVDTPGTNLFGGLLPDPQQTQTNYIDIQQLPSNWSTTMYSDFNSIIASTAPGYNNPSNGLSVPLVLGPDGFFDKPAAWSSPRQSPGQIQQAISKLVAALDSLRQAENNATGDKQALDAAQNTFNSLVLGDSTTINQLNNANQGLTIGLNTITAGYNIFNQWNQSLQGDVKDLANEVLATIPVIFIAGLADGGDVGAPARGTLYTSALATGDALSTAANVTYTAYQVASGLAQDAINGNSIAINNTTLDMDVKNAVQSLGQQELALQGDVVTISQALRAVQDAQAAYQSLVAKGQRIQSDRAAWRRHAAALVQGFRTSDAAFRLFQNEDLQRYLTLFNLAGEYAFLAAQAYDYETGLLGATPQGRSFLNQIISAQALGVVSAGVPQYSSSVSGDPGLAGALAQMNADWQVLKSRLGFNNPDGNGTIVSLRTENYRILEGASGDDAWQQVLQAGRVADITADSDVRRMCLQVGDGTGGPVPGIILSFSTTITAGQNLFGNPLAVGDHNFSPSTFATKIFSAGVCFDGYIGMDNPAGNGGSTNDPTTNPNGLAATPYIYLIPVGQDSMRSPPLGDSSAIRSWNVDDVAVPLPFNVSAADFSSNPFYTSANSLSEPLFALRGHEAFRPVSTTSVFNKDIYGANGSLAPSQFSSSRLIGRSIWNSKWKLVIPGYTLLSDPNQGLDRLVHSVKDVHLYFITYSYAGN